MSGEMLLQLSLLLPLLAVPLLLLFGRWPNLRESITLATGLGLFALVLSLYNAYLDGLRLELSWLELLPGLAISFHLESLSLLFALVASLLWPITSLYAIGYMRAHDEANQTRFYVFFAIAIAATMGLAFSANLFTLFIFYEVLTLSTYPLVTHAGNAKARQGGRTYLGILMTTSIAFFLLAIIGTWQQAGTLDFIPGGVFAGELDPLLGGLLLALFVFGIGKAAIMPFHRWLPAAMVAPTPVSALLHAVAVVKAGAFSLLKIAAFIFGLDLLNDLPSTDWLLYLAGITVILASLVAMTKDNMKARLAYSTIGQLGYISIGALLATQAGILGGAMHIAAHAFGKITLFFCAGAIYIAAHKTEISDMRGLGRQMPMTLAAFFLGAVSIIGLPPSGGAWSKWFLLMATLDAGQLALMVALMLSSLLNIAYLLPIPYRAFFPNDGQPVWQPAAIREAPLPMLIAIGLTASASLALFFYPQPFYLLASSIIQG
ncbi:MAG: monovalent cation/H+ antiporter subunit D family protein [Gammaproteobacteria bacterium]|nr:monovalent cation/H+ antiporter subunit D family protein [Gammaproteobacteria bacterium]